MPTTASRRVLGGITAAAVALTASALLAPPASAEPEPDLWACLPEERAAMGVADGEDCYLTGEQQVLAGVPARDRGRVLRKGESLARRWAR